MAESSASAKKATTYVLGTTILWGSLVEYGVARLLEATALGFVELLFAFSDVQVSLLVGFAEFLADVVSIWTLGPSRAISAAWDGAAFEVFGPAAPIVVLLEILLIAGFATWSVRRL